MKISRQKDLGLSLKKTKLRENEANLSVSKGKFMKKRKAKKLLIYLF